MTRTLVLVVRLGGDLLADPMLAFYGHGRKRVRDDSFADELVEFAKDSADLFEVTLIAYLRNAGLDTADIEGTRLAARFADCEDIVLVYTEGRRVIQIDAPQCQWEKTS